MSSQSEPLQRLRSSRGHGASGPSVLCSLVMSIALQGSVACSRGENPSGSAKAFENRDFPGADARQAQRDVNVYAASSTRNALSEIAELFEAEHAGVRTNVTYAGSQVLRLQVESGATAHVFLSADEAHLRALRLGGFVSRSVAFAGNALAVIVPKSRAQRLATFEMLPNAKRVVLGVSGAPIGRYTALLLKNADARFGAAFSKRVLAQVASRESNARLVRAKIELAEADAAVVYRTDARASERVTEIPVPKEIDVAVKYYAAQLRGGGVAATNAASPPSPRRAFYAYLCSPAAQRVLAQHGFLPGDC